MNPVVNLIGRICLALIFIMAAFGKLHDMAGTMGYMQSAGVPGILIWPTIALELLGGIAIIIGFRTRIAAYALALFTVVAAAIFHHNFSDQMQMLMFMKDIAITGGLLILATSGTTGFSVDKRS
jgi:putative oxidoreductase